MIIIPETKMIEKGDYKYVHYDEIDGFGFEKVTENSMSYKIWPDIYPGDSAEIISENITSIKNLKILRDLINLPKRILKRN